MRILFVGSGLQPDNMEDHVSQTLRAMGHEVFDFDARTIVPGSASIDRYANYAARVLLREPERLCEKRLLNQVAATRPDLVLVLLGSMVSPKTIALLKKHTRSPVVCWLQDALTTLGRQYMLGAPYDLVFVKDRYMVDLFGSMIGARFRYLPEACNPAVHFRELPPLERLREFECDITTAGTLYYYRQAILKPLVDRYDVKVWGNVPDWLVNEIGARHTKRYVILQEKRFAISAARIALNTLHYAEIEGVNCRMFEVAGCGGFQLSSHKSCISEFFEPDREIVTFRDRDDLLDRVKHYLERPEARLEIALRGMQRAHSEHTYRHRLETLLADVAAL